MQDNNLTLYEQALMQFLTMTPQEREAFFKRFKIGLSRQDRDGIKDYVLANTNIKPTPITSVAKLNETYPADQYAPDSQVYKDIYLIESGEDEGHLYWFDTNTMLWTKSILYEDSIALAKKLDKVTGNKKIYATDYQGGQTTLDYEVLPTPNTIPFRQPDGTLAVGTPKEDNDAVNLAYFRSNKIDAHDLMPILEKPAIKPEQFDPRNPIETSMIVDYADKENPTDPDKIDIRLDKGFMDRIPLEHPNLIRKLKSGKHKFQLEKVEMMSLKGLRCWVTFQHNGEQKITALDLYFPKVSVTTTINISVAIPNPFIWEQKVFAEIDLNGVGGGNTCELELKTGNGSPDNSIELLDVIGIL